MQRVIKRISAKELRKRLGEKISELRKDKKLTQAALAEKVGVDSETISRFERAMALPSLERLFDIAQALDIGVGELLGSVSPLAKDLEYSFLGRLANIDARDQRLLVGLADLMQRTK